MKRKAFTILAAISLLLCVPALVVWPFSYRTTFALFRGTKESRSVPIPPDSYPYNLWMFVIGTGKLIVSNSHTFQPAIVDPLGWSLLRTRPFPNRSSVSSLWFRYQRESDPDGMYANTFHLPLWFVALLTAPLPLFQFRRWLRRARLLPGRCRSCGYDLRATPERCPECGAVPQKI